MPFVKNKSKYLAYKEYEPPTKKIVSEGDILIKDLVKKQQNTTINLQECLDKKQNFEKLSEQVSLTGQCSGTSSLQQFQVALDQLKEIEDLRACNLSNDDMKLILDFRDNKLFKYRNAEPSILETKLKSILKLIDQFKENSKAKCDTNKANISHEQNEALSIKPDSTETKLLKFAMQNISDASEKLPHPMDNIKLLESDLALRLAEKKLNPLKIQKQIRRQANKVSSILTLKNSHTTVDDAINEEKVKGSDHCFVSNSKWDLKKADIVFTPPNVLKTYSCKKQNYYTIKHGEIVKLNPDAIPKEITIQRTNRLTTEEIKSMPKFRNYNIGLPSKNLYLKNLPKHIRECDLDTLFSNFTLNSTLLYRIMSGKMKGQAFVTFPDIASASEALDSVNGVLINGKPVIIEFGRNNKEQTEEKA